MGHAVIDDRDQEGVAQLEFGIQQEMLVLQAHERRQLIVRDADIFEHHVMAASRPHAQMVPCRLDADAGRSGIDKYSADARFILVRGRSEEHTSELQTLMRISYAVYCLKKQTKIN